jgi:hypothetical protein
MLIASSADTTPQPSLGQVSAQEAGTPDIAATTTAAREEASQLTADLARLTGNQTPTAPDASATATPAAELVAQQAVSPTPTRVVRATETATPVPTGELPDTGFGGFLQPLAGFALVGVAFAARALRNRS